MMPLVPVPTAAAVAGFMLDRRDIPGELLGELLGDPHVGEALEALLISLLLLLLLLPPPIPPNPSSPSVMTACMFIPTRESSACGRDTTDVNWARGTKGVVVEDVRQQKLIFRCSWRAG